MLEGDLNLSRIDWITLSMSKCGNIQANNGPQV